MKTNACLRSLILAAMIFLTGFTKGQDPNFSQFFNTPLYYNPAFTGLNAGVHGRFTFRDQWPNLPADFKSYYFSADIGDRNIPGSGGIGLIVESDNEGIAFINNLMIGLDIAVRIPIASNIISQVGIKAAVGQKHVDWDDFVFTDQLSERYGNIYQTQFIAPGENKKTFPDFGAGGLIQFTNAESSVYGTAGFAVDHIFQPDVSFISSGNAPLPRIWVVHTDFIISTGAASSSSTSGAGEPLKLNPGILYQNQNGLNSLELGLNLLKYNIYLGGWYKNTMGTDANSSIALLAGYRFYFAENMSIRFMYSYDLQISGYLQGTGGAHEISLILDFEKLQVFGHGGGGGGGYTPRGTYSKHSPVECSTF
jgi:type IX secretion system PorP/SprF family membrane protein